MSAGHLARIEIGLDELATFASRGVAARVAAALRQLGYQHLTLDFQGYRRGSLNT